MACGINLRHKSLAEIAFDTEAQARLQTRGTSLAALGLSSESLAQVQMRSTSLASIQMALGCPTGDDDEVKFIEQDAWYLHPDGEPTNSGATAGQAITQRRFMELTGLGAIVNPTTVHVIGNMSATDPYMGPYAFLPGAYMQWVGEANTELLAPTVVTGSNMSPRRTLTVTGLDWSTAGPGGTSLVDFRVRVTASSVSSRVGVVAVISAVVGGSGDTCYINAPMRTGVVSGSQSSIQPGDTIVVEDLTAIGPVSCAGASYEQVLLNGDLVSIGFSGIKTPNTFGVMNFAVPIRWDGCEINGFAVSGPTYQNVSGSRVNLLRWDMNQTYLYGASLKTQVFGANTRSFAYDDTEALRPMFLETGGYLDVGKEFHFWEWNASFGGGALYVTNGSVVKASAPLAGSSSIANTFGLSVRGGAQYVGTQPTIQGALSATKDFEVAGVPGRWSVDYPVSDPAHAAFLVPAS